MVRIIADTEMMSQVATRMQQQAQELESALGQLSAASGRLNYWEGASYYQFTAMWQQASAQMRTLAQQGQHLGQCLQTTADHFRNTDEQQANWSAGTAASQYPLKPKIEVKAHPIVGLGPFAWHSYILYTDSDGKQHILQFNPEHMPPTPFGAFGKLTMYPADQEDGPGTTIWTYPGTDPAQAYKLMEDEANRIQASHTPYDPLNANSNASVHMMLEAAGFGSVQSNPFAGKPPLIGWNSPLFPNDPLSPLWNGVGAVWSAPGAAWDVIHGTPGAAWDVIHGAPGAAWNVAHGAPGAAWNVAHGAPGAAWDAARWLLGGH